MNYTVVALGNPGDEYKDTRHSVGRMCLEFIRDKYGFSEWKFQKMYPAYTSTGTISNRKTTLVLPDVYMNDSGNVIAKLIKTKSQMNTLIVIHDDIDLGIGTSKLLFNRGSGGHRGVESVSRKLKSNKYFRIKIGISRMTGRGMVKKVSGEKDVKRFVLAKIPTKEKNTLEVVFPKISLEVENIITGTTKVPPTRLGKTII
tara:strand:+ start:2301 stop:2903 length:603 start_codon:yes stop_codon:yes gene_type:complete